MNHPTSTNVYESSTTRSVYLLSLDSTATPAPIQLFSARSSEISEVLWLTDDIFAYLNRSSLYSVPIDTAEWELEKTRLLDFPAEWELEKTRLLDFPAGVNPSGLQYEPKSDILAYTGMVWGDGAFEDVPMYDEAYEKRGDTGLVFDELLIR